MAEAAPRGAGDAHVSWTAIADLIETSVDELTDPHLGEDAKRSARLVLRLYLHHPRSIEIVYDKLLARGKVADYANNDGVVKDVLSVIRTHVLQYEPPSHALIDRMSEWLESVEDQYRSTRVSAADLRALLYQVKQKPNRFAARFGALQPRLPTMSELRRAALVHPESKKGNPSSNGSASIGALSRRSSLGSLTGSRIDQVVGGSRKTSRSSGGGSGSGTGSRRRSSGGSGGTGSRRRSSSGSGVLSPATTATAVRKGSGASEYAFKVPQGVPPRPQLTRTVSLGRDILIHNYLHTRPVPPLFPPRPGMTTALRRARPFCMLFPEFDAAKHAKEQAAARRKAGGGTDPADEPVLVEGVDVRDGVWIRDPVAMSKGFTIIGYVKKLEELARKRSVPSPGSGSGAGGAASPLFVFRYYAEQAPLQLTSTEFDVIHQMVVQPPNGNEEARVVAAKVMLKVWMDVYNDGDPASVGNMLRHLFRMLEATNSTTRVFAYTLLANLAIHANLFEETEYFKDPSLHVDEALRNTQRVRQGRQAVGAKVNQATKSLRIQTIEEDVWQKLREMLLFSLHRNERNPRVWMAGLRVMVLLLARDGEIDKQRLFSLDARIFPRLITYCGAVDPLVAQRLVQMYCNSLYAPPAAPSRAAKAVFAANASLLNLTLLHQTADGIDYLIDLYRTTPSSTVRDNLFVVLFDYATAAVASRKNQPVDVQQKMLAFELLVRYGAPQLFAEVFRFCPDKFADDIAAWVMLHELRGADLADVAAELDKRAFAALIVQFERLAAEHWAVPDEFASRVAASARYGLANDADVDTVRALIWSDVPRDRRIGEAWLFSVLRGRDERRVSKSRAASASKLHHELAIASELAPRLVFVSLCERLALAAKARMRRRGDARATVDLLKQLQQGLNLVVKAGERSPAVLQRVLDAVVMLLALEYAPSDPEVRTNRYASRPDDSVYQQFLAGRVVFPAVLVRELDPELLAYLVQHLPCTQAYSAARATALTLIIDLCRDDANLARLPKHLRFFRRRLDDDDNRTAFLAAVFLVDYLLAKQPLRYQPYLEKLQVDAAADRITPEQREQREAILGNPYLMIRAFLRLDKLLDGE